MFWRRLDPEEDTTDITLGMLDEISTTVRLHVVGGDRFRATHGLVVTWNEITLYGGCPQPSYCPVSRYT
jgi:hypothetical protein